jgi:hypothetical protein
MEFIGHTLQTTGGVLIGITVLLVHRGILKEHKIDPVVFKEIRIEQIIGAIGVVLIIIGYFFVI